MPKLLLVDGSNIMFRSFYGIRPFTTKSGLHTNAVYGMITTLSSRLESLTPDYAAIAFDLPAPTFRHKEYDAYKGTRQKMPPELAEQIPYVRRAAEALGARIVDLEGFEADDILGTLAKRGEDAGLDVYVLTGDRDSLQLITEKTTLLFITNKETITYDEAEFFRNYGTTPPRLVDIKALMGDSSDNIPGVPGVGEKTALKLIAEGKTLDGIYENLDSLSISDKLREKLRAGKESAYMSYRLATICRDAPVKESLDDLALNVGGDRAALSELFSELEFYKLAERFGLKSTPAPATDESSAAQPAAPDALPLDDAAVNEIIEGISYINSTTAEDIPADGSTTAPTDGTPTAPTDGSTNAPAEDAPSPTKIPPIPTKNTRVRAEGAPAVTLRGDTVYIAASDKIYKAARDAEPLLRLFSSVPVICHDYKSLYASMRPLVRVECAFDTMLAAYVLRAGGTSYELPRVSMTYLGENAEPERGEDEAALILRLAAAMKAELSKADSQALASGERTSSDVLYDIEIPLAPVLSDMEAVGVGIDADGIRRYSDELAKAESALAEQIYMLAGHEFNINSPKQLGDVLFVELGLPAGKKTHRGYSTDAETLEGLRGHEIVDGVLAYRQIAKLRGTYGDALADAADENMRVHTSFRQTTAATGRLSSTDPNLQNIPVRTSLGRELRRFFVAQNGRILVDADYSQIELRLLANISGDPVMSSAFLRGADIHASTAAEVFGVPEGSVTRELRSRAKAVNFGIVYGIGDWSLSRDIGTTRKQAAQYIANYLATYKGVDDYLKATVALARERGYVTTMLGRRRYIPEIAASNKQVRAFGERVAMNSPIQGTAADIIKLAMIGVARELESSGLDAKLILQVHDELIVECSPDAAPEVENILRREMESAASLPVPLTVEVTTGASWFDCK